MLEIDRVSWKNFLSYGDYVTTLEVGNLGQCLITGEVLDDADNRDSYDADPLGQKKKSNGAGKTTVVSVIQWVIFGRTAHSAQPGDAVVNWFTGKDCWGRVDFKNGDSITRTRNTGGHNELIYVKDGDENKTVANTLSTVKNQQAELNRAFGLDWDIFCGSTFFSQYGKPWMEMADQARKKALERLLHVDRFGYYAKVAKGKVEKLDTQVERLNSKKNAFDREITRLEAEILRLKESSANFGVRQQEKQKRLLDEAAEELVERDQIVLPDVEKLRAKWEVVRQVQAKIDAARKNGDKLRDEANDLNDAISEHDSAAASAEKKAKLWRDKEGKVCAVCEQEVPHAHVGGRVEPLLTLIEKEKEAATAVRQQQAEVRTRQKEAAATVAKMEAILAQKKPTMTIRDAQSIHASWQQHDKEAKRLQKMADDVMLEENPHDGSVTTAEARIEECKTEIAKNAVEIERLETMNKHYAYVHRAYNDRSRIKSLVFRDHVPFINGRLKHYLDVFGLDVQLELTESLGITSNKWAYEFESGGERMRTNVAFMLATFDFHEHMFGRQCNVLVLDEVDGRLDDDGIDSLINVIKSDLAGRVETILIISHRNQMQDVFAKEIKVSRKSRFSTLEVI